MKCIVKITIDPKARGPSFSVQYQVYQVPHAPHAPPASGIPDALGVPGTPGTPGAPGTSDTESMSIRFIIPKPWQTNFIIKRLSEIIQFNKPCELVLSGCPPAIKDNEDAWNSLRDILRPINKQNFVIPTPPEPSYNMPFPPANFEYRLPLLTPQAVGSIEPPINEYIDMSKVDANRARRSIATMKIHIKEYGAHPNFSDTHTQKNRNKVWNYIKSSLGVPNMSIDEALYIASQLS